MTTAVYLGTFDPFTNGHLDVVTRSSKIFSKVIVGVGNKENKKVMFSLEDRLIIIKDIFLRKKITNVVVKPLNGLAVKFAQEEKATVFIRGLRTDNDFNYEMQMAAMNTSLDQTIDTVFVPARQSLSHVSSSLIKEVHSLQGDISSLVPEEIASFLKSL
jgi:pantetheine-phosphate adenylyltransferase